MKNSNPLYLFLGLFILIFVGFFLFGVVSFVGSIIFGIWHPEAAVLFQDNTVIAPDAMQIRAQYIASIKWHLYASYVIAAIPFALAIWLVIRDIRDNKKKSEAGNLVLFFVIVAIVLGFLSFMWLFASSFIFGICHPEAVAYFQPGSMITAESIQLRLNYWNEVKWHFYLTYGLMAIPFIAFVVWAVRYLIEKNK